MAAFRAPSVVKPVLTFTATVLHLAAGLSATVDHRLLSTSSPACEAASFLQIRSRDIQPGPSLFPHKWVAEKKRRKEDWDSIEKYNREQQKRQKKKKEKQDRKSKQEVEEEEEVEEQQPVIVKNQTVVWIKAVARSGSSFVMALVSHMMASVFTFFEPCHPQDDLEPWLAKKGCAALLGQLSRCDFKGVNMLYGWRRGFLRGANPWQLYQKEATEACQSARLVVFKTVNFGHDMSAETIPFLKKNPHVKMIEVIRDPRSIYASMMRAHGFWGKGVVHDYNATELTHMCDDLDKGLHISHPRHFRVVYEELVAKPQEISMAISSFIVPSRARLGPRAVGFLDKFVNSEKCHGPHSHYTYCRSNSTEPATRYLSLPKDLSSSFAAAESCRRVSRFYNFSLSAPTNRDS